VHTATVLRKPQINSAPDRPSVTTKAGTSPPGLIASAALSIFGKSIEGIFKLAIKSLNAHLNRSSLTTIATDLAMIYLLK
jgi:hypothetical protein